GGQGSRAETNARLELLQEKYPGLEYYATSKFYDQFDIAKSPELEKFKEAYDSWYPMIDRFEARKDPERQLKEGDFYRLFFDSSEIYSVASKGNYVYQE